MERLREIVIETIVFMMVIAFVIIGRLLRRGKILGAIGVFVVMVFIGIVVIFVIFSFTLNCYC